MKILVTGFTGQLGFDVVNVGLKLGLDMHGVGSKELDITEEVNVSNYLQMLNPDAIIHCAAYTAVDKAEDDKTTCWNVNVTGTKNLATAARKINAKFIYISTDYVFDGRGEAPFTELNNANPVGYYGVTKLEGEKIVQELIEEHYIVRISWVFGCNGNNFVKTMLRLSDKYNELNVVGDQIGSPTYTMDLARLLIDMIQTNKYGVYHASNEGFCSWADFATEIFKQTKKTVKVNSISTDQYPTRAVRPRNSRMSKSRLVENGFILLPDWKDALNRYLKEISLEVK
jgi:dTDP-4-dehydrorhamnose reductase